MQQGCDKYRLVVRLHMKQYPLPGLLLWAVRLAAVIPRNGAQ